MRSISLNSCPVIGSAAELIRFSQRLSPCPILLRLTLHCRRDGVLELEPVERAAGAVKADCSVRWGATAFGSGQRNGRTRSPNTGRPWLHLALSPLG